MNGDLSLSQSLGGLRIANPDDEEAVASPTSPTTTTGLSPRPPRPSSHSSGSTVTDATRTSAFSPTFSHETAMQEDESPVSNSDNYPVQTTNVRSSSIPQQSRSPPSPQEQAARSRLSHRQSMPLGHQAQQTVQYPNHSYNVTQQMRQPGPQTTSVRPVSGMYGVANTASGSNLSSQASYRYGDQMSSSDATANGLTRSGSRSVRGVLTQDGNGTYRQSSQQVNGGNGPLPPRRNSKRVRGSTSGSNSRPESSDAAFAGPASTPRTTEEWRERGAAVSTRMETNASGQQQTRTIKKGVKDFNFGRTLGEGSYSTVMAATDRQNLKEYAIKVLDKRHIIKEKKVKYVNIERDTLNRLTEHPGIVRLYYTFQDERSLYFVLDLASSGELLGVLKKLGSFDMECTRFYGAEILDSVAYMHSRGIIHRDLKPENVLLDREMHVKITDFGTAKILPDPKTHTGGTGERPGDPTDGADTDRAVSFVGTAEYVSPELLRDKNACKASDLWAFGCIIYQLLAGRPPFKAANEYLTFQKILALDYSFPGSFPEVARDLVERLLVLEPANRLPVEHIKNHRFFDGIQWGKGLWKQKAPRLKAYMPPPNTPIKLNGSSKNAGGLAASAAAAALTSPITSQMSTPQPPLNTQRPQIRAVTELPPPSQLDIDWSPVLTHNNERILKLGNLIFFTGPQPHNSPNSKNGDEAGTPTQEKPKFRSLFSGNTTRKRERLVLITSSARLIIAAAGGNEKKAKMEVNLLATGTSWKSFVDGKGLTAWQLDTRDKHLTFEDPRATTSDPAGSKFCTQEWLVSLEQARELAVAQAVSGSYSDNSILNNLDSVSTHRSSPHDSLSGDAAMPMSGPNAGERHLRQTLRKTNTEDSENFKGRKRFSKRHSKSGLAAVF